MEKYKKLLIKLANRAKLRKEVPVGCIIVRDGVVLSKAYNKREKKCDPTAHAEVIAIRRACKKLNTWKLDECELWVTLKPCEMCESVIKESRIKKVFYLVDKNDEYKSLNKTVIYEKAGNYMEYNKLLKEFFESIRK